MVHIHKISIKYINLRAFDEPKFSNYYTTELACSKDGRKFQTGPNLLLDTEDTTWNDVDSSWMKLLECNFTIEEKISQILFYSWVFSVKNWHLKKSAKYWPFCSALKGINETHINWAHMNSDLLTDALPTLHVHNTSRVPLKRGQNSADSSTIKIGVKSQITPHTSP